MMCAARFSAFPASHFTRDLERDAFSGVRLLIPAVQALRDALHELHSEHDGRYQQNDIVERSPAHEALMNYQQADMDGIMVTVSRQAIHEVDDEITRLRSRLDVEGSQLVALDRSHADLARKLAKVGAENERLKRVAHHATHYAKIARNALVRLERAVADLNTGGEG